jgi:hypothetical protein
LRDALPPRYRHPTSGRVSNPLQTVEDEIETKLELVPVAIAGLVPAD